MPLPDGFMPAFSDMTFNQCNNQNLTGAPIVLNAQLLVDLSQLLSTNQQNDLINNLNLAQVVTPETVSTALQNTNSTQANTALSGLVCGAGTNNLLDTDIAINPLQAVSSFVATCKSKGKLGLLLTIGADLLGGGVKVLSETFTNNVCPSTSTEATLVQYETVGNNTGLAPAINAIVNKLDRLLKCCNPCPDLNPSEFFFLTGHGDVDNLSNVDYIQVTVTETQFPIDGQLASPNFMKYGALSFFEANNYHHETQFINFENVKMLSKSSAIVGFSYNLSPGVQILVQVYTKAPFTPIPNP